ncbi:hypothetical protein [Marinobacterium marinum]|uniref:Uncharacterized protein n=1 Tax=Marinobacterium marinum TaxID=2756129 RepID=A0A7W1WV64_9GAMM|nr:hypothetical protein [Marinobacterium marinum]MBA4500845.1 hypothetical protein [Marinobacterium marinum]
MTDLQLLIAQHTLSDGAARRPQYLKTDWFLHKDIRKSVTRAEVILLQAFEQMRNAQGSERLHRSVYEPTMRVLLANLWNTYLHGRELILPASSSDKAKDNKRGYSPSIGRDIIKFLSSQGYIAYQAGKANSYNGVASWGVATSKLISLIESCEGFIIAPAPRFGAILRATKEKGKDTAPEIPLKGRHERSAKKHGRVARKLNELLANSVIQWPVDTHTDSGQQYVQTPITLTRIFNNGSWAQGGRFYGDHQSLDEEKRGQLLINGESVVELDYSALHFRMIYAESGIQYPLNDDPYGPAGSTEREANKRIALKLFNSEKDWTLRSSITRSGDQQLIDLHNEYTLEYQRYLEGKRDRPPQKPLCLQGFIKGMPSGTRGDDALNELYANHPIIRASIDNHDGNYGLYLQYKDSEIMALVLEKLVDEHVPALPVHDSVIVPTSKQRLAQKAMAEAFSTMYPNIMIPICEKRASL